MLLTRPWRFVLHLLWVSALGLLPASLVWLGGRASPEPWRLLETEARHRAELIDAVAERWLRIAADQAAQLSPLLAQLPEGQLGTAASGTLQLFLDRRLAEDQEADGYLVLELSGRPLLQAARPEAPPLSGLPEVAGAAARPALVAVRAPAGPASLYAAAPIKRGEKVSGLFAARLRRQVLDRLLPGSQRGIQVNLVDATGLQLGRPLAGPELARLGGESRPGRTWIAGRPAAFAPIQSARAVLVVAGGPPNAPAHRWHPLHLLALAVVLLGAPAAAWRLSVIRTAR